LVAQASTVDEEAWIAPAKRQRTDT